MNSKWRTWLTVGLFVAVVGGAIYLPGLRRQVEKAKNLTEKTAEQARRELLPPAPVSGEPRVKAKMFWGSNEGDSMLVPVTVELPLSSDPTLRAKQILNTLLAGPVDPEARTLPPDAALLAFYILPDGTAVADFSEALANSIPSG
ncbi:MAG: GerMN domain-containing protein, partial [Candidatus Acidiferrum sp.]